uniref:Uncharacterized protein n=1 Tax=virus sp. ctDYl1 TaxID=2826795 RepID=A0A8S5R9Q5_9VIRU|nr:MAG TPA: hypothetical protein [virus sp. ctDYl1]
MNVATVLICLQEWEHNAEHDITGHYRTRQKRTLHLILAGL